MDLFMSIGSSPSAADQNGTSPNPEAAGATDSEAAGPSIEPSGEDEVVQVAPPAAATARGKSKKELREEKIKRVKTEHRKSKPAAATAVCWKHFGTYVRGALRKYAICNLCIQQQEWERAEIAYNSSPSNLLRHLNTDYPGHRAAYDACADNAGKTPAARGTLGGGSGAPGTTPSVSTFFGPDTAAWHQQLVRWMVMNAIPFSMLADKSFRTMVHAIRPSARVPDKKECVTTMRGVKKHMMSKVAELLKDEYVCVTSDAWTSCANDTYSSLTITLITSAWELITVSVDCSKSVGTTTGEALAAAMKALIAKHSITGKVTAFVSDCEPSMVKTGRILEDGDVCIHVGCTNNRLESTTSLVFNGPGVKRAMTLARGLVTRYTTSSQMGDRLGQFVKIYLDSENKKPIQDVVTRWWSTCAMVERLLELREPIGKHEEADKLEPMLTATDWAVLQMILPILEPFMQTQTLLEGRKYVTGSLVVPFIHDRRANLEEATYELEIAPPSADAVVNKAREAVMPCVRALQKDFINRWGDGSNILTYTEGPRRQPRGFKPIQVLATALDPRTKILYGTSENQHADVWDRVQKEAVKIALKIRQESNSGGVSQPSQSAAGSTAGGGSASSRKRQRGGGGFMVAAQSAGRAPIPQTGGGSADDSTTSLIVNTVRLEVEAFQAALPLQMYEDKNKNGGDEEGKDGAEEGEDDREEEENHENESSRVYLNPLEWWRLNSALFPHLAVLARRVLAVPATQAESERLFSCAGNVVTKNRNKLAPPTVELLVLLRHSWKIVEEWEESKAAAARRARGGLS
ncbi:unnamed protein product [Ectocarpus sp. 4 AP-2014]